jgi:hypothetical protein
MSGRRGAGGRKQASPGRATPKKAAPTKQAAPLITSPAFPAAAPSALKPSASQTRVDPGVAIGKEHHPKVKPMIEEIQRLRGSKVITYYLADGAAIGEDVVYWLYEHLLRLGHQDKIDLYLVSRGGATEVPWRIVTLIREFTDSFSVLVPFHAQSAATHISLGANEIVMTELGQLGPVDPSRQHPLLPEDKFQPAGQDPKPLSISVQDLRQFIQFVADDENGLKVEDSTAIY